MQTKQKIWSVRWYNICSYSVFSFADERHDKQYIVKNPYDLEVFRHSISDVRSEVLWRFFIDNAAM